MSGVGRDDRFRMRLPPFLGDDFLMNAQVEKERCGDPKQEKQISHRATSRGRLLVAGELNSIVRFGAHRHVQSSQLIVI